MFTLTVYTVMFISNFNHVRLSLDNKRLLTYLLTYVWKGGASPKEQSIICWRRYIVIMYWLLFYFILLHCICICIEMRSAISSLNDWLIDYTRLMNINVQNCSLYIR